MHHLIVDTENYSGDFYRQMVAFATGCYGECDVGDDLAQRACAEMTHHAWWEQHIIMQKDENPELECWRPVSLEITPGFFMCVKGLMSDDDTDAERFQRRSPVYLSLKIQVDELPPQDVWEEFQERVIAFCETVWVPPSQPKAIALTGVRQQRVAPASNHRM